MWIHKKSSTTQQWELITYHIGYSIKSCKNRLILLIIFSTIIPYVIITRCWQLTVTVARSPSGTLATMIPIKKITASSQLYFRMNAMMKKDTPRKTATLVMIWMKCVISIAIGVLSLPRPLARLAIRPITVLSPVCTAIPMQLPSNPLVEKKVRFLVSSGFSLVQSGPRLCGSDSPVSEELST